MRYALFVAALGAGCGPGNDVADAGRRHGWYDAAGQEAGGVDAGEIDAGAIDAGGIDAGIDAGGIDGGYDAGGIDAGPDAGRGPITFDDVCGAAVPAFVITDTTTSIMVSTSGYTDDEGSRCAASTPGNDVFIAVDVLAGEYWHFHVSALTPGRRPVVTLTAGCSPLDCDHASNACTAEGDEHFAFVAPASGRWFLGIDDELAGGGNYVLSAFRPSCGNDLREHGEGCDDGDNDDGDGCDHVCREELSGATPYEVEPNDNFIEANALGAVEVTGGIGGPGACRYPDMFVLSVPADGDVEVTALAPDGTACTSGTLTPYRLFLENSAGNRVGGDIDAMGCATFAAVDLPAGEYAVVVAIADASSTVTLYRIRVALTP